MNIRLVHKNIRETYNKIAMKYHVCFHCEMEQKPFDRNYLDGFVSSFSKDAILCDAGCGPSAHIGKYLFNKGFNVFGIDISDRCIENAKSFNPGMKFFRTDFLDWNTRENPVDAIIAFYSIIFSPKKDIDKIIKVFI